MAIAQFGTCIYSLAAFRIFLEAIGPKMKLENLISPAAYLHKFRKIFGIKYRGSITYDADGMRLFNKNASFVNDAKFKSAYLRGMNSGHHIGRPVGSTDDIHVEWRSMVECWAASQGMHLDGDFVSCGVNTGIFPLAICEYVNLDSSNKLFWLFDTYDGVPESQMSAAERHHVVPMNEAFYSDTYDTAVKNFKPFSNARLVRGMVPDSLTTVDIDKVSYLSIDMNIAYPERMALEYFWPKLTSGAIVVFDDYAFVGAEEQKNAIDEFCEKVGVFVLPLPTGQGILKKP